MAKDRTEDDAITILWRVENISMLETAGKYTGVKSPDFRPYTRQGKTFSFYILPKVITNTNLFLIMNDDTFGFEIDCEWSILNSDESTVVGGRVQKCVSQLRSPFLSQQYSQCLCMHNCPTYEEVFVTRKTECLPNDTLTVRFRIWKSEGNFQDSIFISCRTLLNTSDYFFTWPISNFSFIKLNEEVICPELFNSLEIAKSLSVKLTLSNTGYYLVLDQLSSNKETFLVKFKFSIWDKSKETFKSAVNDHLYEEGILSNDSFTVNILTTEEFSKKNSDYLANGVLTLLCEIHSVSFTNFIVENYHGFDHEKVESLNFFRYLEEGSETSNQSTDSSDTSFQTRCATKNDRRSTSMETYQQSVQSCFERLVEDFLNLYKDQNMTDFKLRSGDVSFPVHRNILSARCPVFKEMFSSEMKEPNSDSMDVTDLDSHTLNRFLTFLYTGTVEQELCWEGAAKLYYAADKYQVSSLKERCSSVLHSSISVSNVSDILSLADRHDDKDLTSFVQDFAVNHLDEIMQSEEWKRFTERDPAFAGKTMIYLYNKKFQSNLQ